MIGLVSTVKNVSLQTKKLRIMLRHIVMIKLNDSSNNDKVALELKEMLLNLQLSIEELLDMEVGLNNSTKPSAMDVVLIADFNDVAGLDKYRVHSEHIKVLNFLKEVADYMKVVDYEL